MDKLRSRKLWVAVLSAALFAVQGEYNQAVAILMTYIGAQGVIDYKQS